MLVILRRTQQVRPERPPAAGSGDHRVRDPREDRHIFLTEPGPCLPGEEVAILHGDTPGKITTFDCGRAQKWGPAGCRCSSGGIRRVTARSAASVDVARGWWSFTALGGELGDVPRGGAASFGGGHAGTDMTAKVDAHALKAGAYDRLCSATAAAGL